MFETILMKSIFYLLCILSLISCADPKPEINRDFTTAFEKSEGTQTPTYHEVIAYYKNIAQAFPTIGVFEMGMTDSGEPLHLVVFDKNGVSKNYLESDNNKTILLINNGIHPGESDGIDASMMFLRDLANGSIPSPENTAIAIIPIYNIGGALNRNSTSRTDQNGPEAYGFRGNARNYDLNRDFIKADTKNAKAFAQLYHLLNPEWFIDNHVSNGADYQYTLTHLFTQHNKLGGDMGDYLHTAFMPEFVDSLASKQWDITPYVNVFNQTPEQGFSQFMDHPRYSTGYTTLFNTIGMMVETHMLKPYKQRVEGTYELMKTFLALADRDANKIRELRAKSVENLLPGNTYPISWTIDSTRTTTFDFKGFDGTMEISAITGANRLKYHRDRPFIKPLTYYNYFKPDQHITIPSKYLIPKGYWNVIEQLENNQIIFNEIKQDTLLMVEVYKIKDYATFDEPFEGHYPHYNTQVTSTSETMQAHQGDVIVNTQQPGIRYILETLEPSAPDSFFNWNYFDTVLQQKEGFSPYVWEDMALEFLQANPEIKNAFETKKANDATFAGNWYEQLDWIHKQSSNYEKSHLRYPVVRMRD